MRRLFRSHSAAALLGLLALGVALAALACTEATQDSSAQVAEPVDASGLGLDALAQLALDPDPLQASAGIEALRQAGPEGHATLMRVHATDIATLRDAELSELTPRHARLRHAIDLVSAQRDGHASGLYWYTEREAALAEARRRHVPVLALRLLGRLDMELSCANSRYFRTTLYPDPSIASRLFSQYVLLWESERPAPRITIDMGDGRTMERTITGNSVHYVLDREGRVIDAIPGLYSPTQFARALDDSHAIWNDCGSRGDDSLAACLAAAHRSRHADARRIWEARSAGDEDLPTFDALHTRPETTEAPSAMEAMLLTLGKASIEAPLMRTIRRAPLDAMPDRVRWTQVSRPDVLSLQVSDDVVALIRLKTRSGDPRALAMSLGEVASLDGFRNEMTFHAQIHVFFSERSGGAALSFEELNTRVYAELFLTPANDPWLGLRAGDLWDAVEALEEPAAQD